MTKPIFENCILYLIGFPGSGKYTIGKHIASCEDHFKLVDNHLMNNPVFSLIERGTKFVPPQAWVYIDKIYDAVIETIENLSPAHYSFIFTNVLSNEDPDDRRFFDRVTSVAEKRGAHFIPVRLHCDRDEAKKRLITAERAERFKLTKPEILDHILKTKTLLSIEHSNLLDLDVTEKTVEQVTKTILDHINKIQE